MATRYGHQVGEQLVRERGWAWAPASDLSNYLDEAVFGDRGVVDPVTGEVCGPHDARRRQDERDLAAGVDVLKYPHEGGH